MRVLFDENVDRRLRRFMPEVDVLTAGEAGTRGLANGELLAMAEAGSTP